MRYYHATSAINLASILENGLNAGFDSCVYMTKLDYEALRFTALRCYDETAVIEINIPRQYRSKVEETFDHSVAFYGCRAFGYFGNIPKEWCKCKAVYYTKPRED